MNYKKWPDWLKGGVICATFTFVYCLLILIISLIIRPDGESDAGLIIYFISIPTLIPFFIIPGLTKIFISYNTFLISVFLVDIATYFIAGAIIGFFHGKLKNVKILKSEQQTNTEFFLKWPDWLKGVVMFAILAIIFWFILFVTGFKF